MAGWVDYGLETGNFVGKPILYTHKAFMYAFKERLYAIDDSNWYGDWALNYKPNKTAIQFYHWLAWVHLPLHYGHMVGDVPTLYTTSALEAIVGPMIPIYNCKASWANQIWQLINLYTTSIRVIDWSSGILEADRSVDSYNSGDTYPPGHQPWSEVIHSYEEHTYYKAYSDFWNHSNLYLYYAGYCKASSLLPTPEDNKRWMIQGTPYSVDMYFTKAYTFSEYSYMTGTKNIYLYPQTLDSTTIFQPVNSLIEDTYKLWATSGSEALTTTFTVNNFVASSQMKIGNSYTAPPLKSDASIYDPSYAPYTWYPTVNTCFNKTKSKYVVKDINFIYHS